MKRAFWFGVALCVAGGLIDTFSARGLSDGLLVLFIVVGGGVLGLLFVSADDPGALRDNAMRELAHMDNKLSVVIEQLAVLGQQNTTTQQGVATVQQTLSFIITKAKLDQLP